MKRLVLITVFLVPYLLTGFFVVRGDEAAVVRRFGAVVRNASGEVRLWPSGWHYDWPWPWASVDRVNLNAVRTLSIGNLESDEPAQSGFLRSVDPARQAQFLSGDKNILLVQISVSYRVSESAVDDFLFAAVSPERRLRTLAESVLADAMLHSGVDFVHTLGRNELRERMTSQLQRLARDQRLGLTVDDVTIGNVAPPLRVKAEFLDVMNARADKGNRDPSGARVRRTTRGRSASDLTSNNRRSRSLPASVGRGRSSRVRKFRAVDRAVPARGARRTSLVHGGSRVGLEAKVPRHARRTYSARSPRRSCSIRVSRSI